MSLDLNELIVSQVCDAILRNLIRPDGIIPNDWRDFMFFRGIRKNNFIYLNMWLFLEWL